MDEEVNRDNTDEADGMNLEVNSKDKVMHTQFFEFCVRVSLI